MLIKALLTSKEIALTIEITAFYYFFINYVCKCDRVKGQYNFENCSK